MVGTQMLTEISGYQITVGAAAATITGVAATAATLNNDTTGEPYESVLVTLTNVKLKTLTDSCWSSTTGIWTHNVIDNNWVFFPRKDATANAEGGTTGGTCP